jgi:hypothetical protein
MALVHRRSNDSLVATARRAFTIVDLAPDRRCVGAIAYRTEESVEVLRGHPGQLVGLWSIIQVPTGGTVHIATSASAEPRTCFGDPADAWRSGRDRLQVDLGVRRIFKIGLSPSAVKGRWAYVRKVPGGYLVVGRRFHPQPWRLYADAPLFDLESQGDALQLYNDDGSSGEFGEVETHGPAVVVGEGTDRAVDASLTVVALVIGSHLRSWLADWLGESSAPQAVVTGRSFNR